ncbi:MAG: hypothetical protein GY877_01675 [Hyphomicrobium sp.]|nr:hypothetical protein [Hyphomicrobium sp.]
MAHASIPHDWGTVIQIDPGAWVRGMRAKLDALLDDPQDETAALELLEIYSLTPMDAEAEKARNYWTQCLSPRQRNGGRHTSPL